MTTYKDIRGTHIKTVTTDPPEPQNGQMWYNSTTQVVKGVTSNPIGAYSSAPNLNNGRSILNGSGGTQTSAIMMGGYAPALPSPERSDYVEEWNGSSWTETTDLNTRRVNPSGTATSSESAICIGGYGASGVLGNVETWDGSSWTEIADMPTATDATGSCGTQTNALSSGGRSGIANNQYWNGSSWTELGDLNNGKSSSTNIGTYTAALNTIGRNSPPQAARAYAELWNGSAWTEVADLNTGRSQGGGSGTSTQAIVLAGEGPGGPEFANSEKWNGSTWTETTDIVRNKNAVGTSGRSGATPSGAFIWAGGSPTFNESYLYNEPTTATVTFTTS